MPLKSRLKKLLRHDRSSSSATPAPKTASEQGSFAVPSALLEPNHDPNPSPSPINDPQLTIPEGLWGEAYESLRTENAELLNTYENILLLNWHSEDNDAEGKESINSRLRALINNRLEELQKSRLKFNVAGKEVVVKDEVHRALKSILSVNNFITTAVSSDPHASLAWAGVLVLLNPIAQSATQDEEAMQGFERIASLLARYRIMEQSWIQVYSFKIPSDREGSIEKLNISIRSQTVRLYTAILKFQMRLAKHYLKSGVYRFLEDVITVNDWNGMMQTITDLDKYITDDLRALSDQTLQGIQNKMNDLQNDLGGLLHLTSEARDEAKAAKQAEQLNSLSYARNAAFNTYESQQKSGCHPGTQVNILRRIKEWCESPGGELIYWLNGMAGTGKSTISYTLAAACCTGEALVDDTHLSHSVFIGASFFFKHSEADQNNGKKLFTTICRQLADLLPEVRSDICNAISSHSNISNEVMSNQWESLILRPLLALDKRGLVPLNFIVVIDALDECLPEDASTLIRLIKQAGKLNNIRLRFFVTSRPEPHIIKWFENCKGSVSKMELPKVTVKNQSHSPTFKNDITRFLEVELAHIGTSHEAPDGWPGETAIENLTLKSDGLFIYAATACRFLNESGRNRRRLQHRMDIIFDDKLVAKSPGGGLNTMYSKILISSFGANLIEEERIDLHKRFKQVVGSIIMLCQPLSPIDLSNILGCSREDVDDTLDGLSSVLSKGEDEQKPISLLHLSFRDFLLDQTCDEQFRIDPKISHEALLENCLEIMAKGLRRNICGFEDESVLAESVQPSLVNLHIHGHLQYACCYWVDHLQKSAIQTLSDDGAVHCFLKEHFLHWLEAMSLMRKMSEGVQAVLHLHEYISGLPSEGMESLPKMAHDARRFVLRFPAIIGHSPLQVYNSALIYAPDRSLIRTHFQADLPKSIVGFPEVEKEWSPLLQTIPDHGKNSWVGYSYRANIAFSPDGKLIASSIVCLWDVHTGALLKRFDPLGVPRYVAFSDDGEQIMALSMEGNVRTWDVSSGVLLQEVNMCTKQCRAFLSHDKTTMACYLGNSVKVVAIATQRVILSFDVHSERRGNLEISQNNRLLACGFNDGSVQLWNIDTGRIQHELFHHQSIVVHVAFSSDETLVLSVFDDGTLALWDTDTGALQESFQGSIVDAIFSLDSKFLIYTSEELGEAGSLNRVFFWDLESSILEKTMPSDLVGLRLSSDGRLVTSVPVVCERLDGLRFRSVLSQLIQVWDTASGKLINTLGSHSDSVLDVIFSPDARFMASYAQDKTLRIWDLYASPSEDKREKHDSAVISIFLSANLEVISLSGSYDKVYKFWDVKARASLQQDLSAHCIGPVRFTTGNEFLIESESTMIVIVGGATGKCVRSISHPLSFGYEYSLNPQTRLIGKSHRHTFDYWNQDHTKLGENIPMVKIWDLDTGKVVQTLYGPRKHTVQLKFSPDGQFLALQRSLAEIIEVIEIWDVKSWQLHRKLAQEKERLGRSFIWSPDGSMIGILFDKMCSDGSTTTRQFDIWYWNSGRLVSLFEQTFPLDTELYLRTYRPMFSVFSGDRKLATANASESIIQLWNIETYQMIGQRQFTSLEENYSSKELDRPMFFSEDSQTLKTRHGRLDVRSFDPNWDGVGSRDLFVDDGWVFHGQKKFILLPHDYWPTCVLAVDNTLVMGHASGHVTFLALAPQDSSE